MGMILGKIDVAEPAFDVMLSRQPPTATIPYEIRKYGTRFAIETEFVEGAKDDNMRSPFMALAGYIGVISDPENEGATSIAMTAPVAMMDTGEKKGIKIDMTAPVVLQETGISKTDSSVLSVKKMQFILPAEYDTITKIPKPTNPDVIVKEIPPAIGAVHRFNGRFNERRSRVKVSLLVKQLIEDGVSDMTEEEALTKFQYWGYNPPFTIPFLRRNEVWIELTKKQVDYLVKKFSEQS